MRPEHSDISFLWDMREASELAILFSRGRSEEDLRSDRQFRMALERALAIVGEASCSVSREFKDAHPSINWDGIEKTRHIVVHRYREVKYDILWRIATEHCPELVSQLTPILDANPPTNPGSSKP